MSKNLNFLEKHSAGKGNVLANYRGMGKLSIFQKPEYSFDVTFILNQFEYGEILVFCPEIPKRFPIFEDRWLNQSFQLRGFTEDGYEITCPELSIKEGNTSFEEEKSHLLFIAKDNGKITLEKNLNKDIVFQKFISGISNFHYSGLMHQINLDNKFSVKIIRSESVDIRTFTPNHEPIFSGEWVFEGIINDIGQIESYITGLNILTSLLTCEDIDSYFLDYYQNGEIVKKILFSTKKSQYHGNLDVVNVADPFERELSEIINLTFPNYFDRNKTLDLNNLFYFKRKSEQAESDEIKFILGVIAIEAICSKFEEYLTKKLKFSLPRANIKDKANTIKKQMQKHKIATNDVFVKELSEKLPGFSSFRDKIQILCEFYGITYSEQDLKLVALRNKMIHNGKVPSSINLQIERYRLSDFISRICLTLINYNGKYYSWMESSYIELIRENPKSLSEIRYDNNGQINFLWVLQNVMSKIRDWIRINYSVLHNIFK